MPQHPFRLATLLRLRETVRDRRRVELAESRQADDELRRQLEQLRIEQQRTEMERRAAAGPGDVRMKTLLETDRYAAVLRAKDTELREQRRTLAAEIERRRAALLEADREVRSLEKLRERHQELQRQEAERQQSKQLDEAALNMVVR